MAGVLIIISVPTKRYESEVREKHKSAKVVIEKEKYEKTSKIIHELRENKRFGTIKSSIESYLHNDDNGTVISKCKSTECLHSNDKEGGLYKSRSENTLNENDKLDSLNSEQKSYTKSSWEEIKQVIRPRRNKLKITQPVPAADILATVHWDMPLEIVLSEVIQRLDIKNAVWTATKDNNFWKVLFTLESGSVCEELVEVLTTFGIGSRHQSSVSVIPCALYYTSDRAEARTLRRQEDAALQGETESTWPPFFSSVRTRTNLAQVLHKARAEAALTFDWLFLLIVAALVAAIGLVENSTVILVVSMLISPLIRPITAGTLGTALGDRTLQQMGVVHEMLGLFLSLLTGFISGLVVCAVDEQYGPRDWPTYEMMSRCEIRSLWAGLIVAIPSGAGVALAALGEYTASLAGAAISASLLPPAVNAGLLWAMALVHLIFMHDNTRWAQTVKTEYYSNDRPTELAMLGTVSLCLTLINVVCIFLAGVVVYKVKNVGPLHRKDMLWWKANRTTRHTSKSHPSSDNTSATWDIYSKFSNESGELKQGLEKRDTTLGLIQSDTVTYRRHTPSSVAHRLRAQNIEAYYLQKAQTADSYAPMSFHTDHKIQKMYDNNLDLDPKMDNDKNDYDKADKSLDFDSKYSFYNLGFDELEGDTNANCEDKSGEQKPTLELSSNFTVDPKKCGPVLGSKSFHV